MKDEGREARMEQYRQGDVLLEKVEGRKPRIPKDRVRGGHRHVLAHGEATGHAHVLKGASKVMEDLDGRRFVQVLSEGGVLVHDEHEPIALLPGTYEIKRQREYSPEEIRNVAD